MILVNTDYYNDKELEMLGLVKGSTIQTKNIGRDITQGLKTIVGGELKSYNEMMDNARSSRSYCLWNSSKIQITIKRPYICRARHSLVVLPAMPTFLVLARM